MRNAEDRTEISIRPFIFMALLLSFEPVYPQKSLLRDPSTRAPKRSFILIKERDYFVSNDTIIKITGTLIPARTYRNDKTLALYDSLKSMASKSSITRTLFDLVIVSPDTNNKKNIIKRSDEAYRNYSGIRIRNIQIRRLNVFGSNIDNPDSYHPNRVERVLNSTHMSTNENIIRKNLLFAEGDTISPLRLTDNERILRQLPFMNDARITVVPVSNSEADIVVVTKDVYSLGGDFTYRGKGQGSIWLFDKNIFGMGHEFKVEVPYSSGYNDSPGIGLNYDINNIWRTFVNLNLFYYNGLGKRTYGFALTRNLISSETKYAGGISIRQMFTTEDLDTLPAPQPLAWNFQDYWLMRSFLIDRESVSRIILGLRFCNNNVFERPFIKPDTYYRLQRYRLYLGSISFSRQKYYKTNLIYSYGRTEDIPYGGLIRLTGGIENNEQHMRGYLAADAALGRSFLSLGYFYTYAGFGAFFTTQDAKQGVLSLGMKYFSNLIPLGKQVIRNFININYTRGIDRNPDEYLTILKNNGFTGFSNDSLRGYQRLTLSLETVVFTPATMYGFRFAFWFRRYGFPVGRQTVGHCRQSANRYRTGNKDQK